jgi:hypothetical protein
MTWKLISDTTISTAVTPLVVTGIPNTYTDLWIQVGARNSSNENPFWINVNNSGANHFTKNLGVYPSSTPFYSQDPAGTSKWEAYGTATGGGLYWGVNNFYFKNYATSQSPKPTWAYSGVPNNGGYQLGFHSFSWSNTSEISSLYFTTKAATNFDVGTRVVIYGILVS